MPQNAVRIAPSILAADFARLGEQVAETERCGEDRIHVDVMDGHFVPNISIGAPIVKSLRRVTRPPSRHGRLRRQIQPANNSCGKPSYSFKPRKTPPRGISALRIERIAQQSSGHFMNKSTWLKRRCFLP